MKLQFSVDDMSCQHCMHRIESVVGGCEEVESVNIDLEGKTVTVTSSLEIPALVALFDEAGYTAMPVSEDRG